MKSGINIDGEFTYRQQMKKIILLVQEYYSLIESDEFKNNQNLLAKNYVGLIAKVIKVEDDL